MKDADISAHIEGLVAEEHRLLERRDDKSASEGDHARLREIEVELDRYYDLMRQRRARRDAGQDPDESGLRSESTVEGYLQ